MAKTPKEYTVLCHHRGRVTEYTGTLEHLTTRVFGYTLECGHSYEWERGARKVNLHPKSGKGLVAALNNAVENTQGGCFNRDYYELKEG